MDLMETCQRWHHGLENIANDYDFQLFESVFQKELECCQQQIKDAKENLLPQELESLERDLQNVTENFQVNIEAFRIYLLQAMRVVDDSDSDGNFSDEDDDFNFDVDDDGDDVMFLDDYVVPQKGLTQARIEKFHRFLADQSLVGERCSICQDDIEEVGRRMMRLDCDGRHNFCQGCAERWFADHNTCPNCRKVFDEN